MESLDPDKLHLTREISPIRRNLVQATYGQKSDQYVGIVVGIT